MKVDRKAPNCFQCMHFFVTYDKNCPRGCRAMGFKSKEWPSLLVRRSSGQECLRFQEKKDPVRH